MGRRRPRLASTPGGKTSVPSAICAQCRQGDRGRLTRDTDLEWYCAQCWTQEYGQPPALLPMAKFAPFEDAPSTCTAAPAELLTSDRNYPTSPAPITATMGHYRPHQPSCVSSCAPVPAFKGEFLFLSNFFWSKCEFEGLCFPYSAVVGCILYHQTWLIHYIVAGPSSTPSKPPR